MIGEWKNVKKKRNCVQVPTHCSGLKKKSCGFGGFFSYLFLQSWEDNTVTVKFVYRLRYIFSSEKFKF